MFKRANKITALLVAAASVMSIVPAMAADTTRLGTKEGTIENAVAFKDGKYVYEGYRTSSDDKSVYYNAGDKDKDLTTLTDANLNYAYSDKYAYANDGSDEYLVDLTNGSVIDDQTPGDDADNAATKLKSNLKKTERYGDLINVTALTDLTELSGTKFGETWYKYGVTTADTDATFNLVGTKLYGYTNGTGKYIDASNVANIYAYSSIKDKVVKISEFSATTNDEDSDTKLQATLLAAPTYLAQDKDNIYQKITVRIHDANTVTETAATAAQLTAAANAVTTAQTAYNTAVSGLAQTAAVTAAQATLTTDQATLTAAQATLTADQANVAKTVADLQADQAAITAAQATVTADQTALATAQAALATAVADSASLSALKATLTAAQTEQTRLLALGSAQAVADRTATYIQKISKAQGDTKDNAYLPKTVASYELSKNYYDNGDGDDAFDADAVATSYQVTNGTLFAIKNTGSNVKVVTMNLKKDKVKFDASSLPTAHANISDKVDVYLVEKGDDDDTDINASAGVSVDVDGNVWAIHEGKIYKFVSGAFAEQFTCDRSMDSLDVYDANSLVAWDASGDVYTTVTEGTKVTQGEATVVAPAAPVTGWVKGTDGTWTFNDATGAKVVSKWINVGGSWYYLKADGIMATGWYNDNGTWYYLAGSGAMATGWLNDNGTWYYLAGSGAMLANTTVDGYKLGASGAWVK